MKFITSLFKASIIWEVVSANVRAVPIRWREFQMDCIPIPCTRLWMPGGEVDFDMKEIQFPNCDKEDIRWHT